MMYAQQNAIDPSLAALLQTAQMVTPDGNDTVAAQYAQAAQQKMQPQGIMQGMQGPQGMQGAKQDYAAAAPSMMRNMQQAQVQQMMQQAMQPQPAGIEGLPAQNMQGMQRMADGGVVGYSGEGSSFVNLSDAEIERLPPDKRMQAYKERLSRPSTQTPTPRSGLGIASSVARKLGPLALLAELFGTSDADIATLEKAEQERRAMPVEVDSRPRGQENYEPAPQLTVGNAPRVSPEAQRLMDRQLVPAPRPPAPAPRPSAQPTTGPAPTGVAALAAQPTMDLSRYEKAGAEDRAAIEKIIAAQEANSLEKAKYMATRPKFEQEGIAALTKANQAREEMLAKERADDAYRRQQALLDQIGRRNLNAYSQEEARQRQRDLSAAEAQRLYEQAVIKQREAEFLQGAGRFEEAKKALDDKEKILSAMQTRLNQSRQTEAGIAERRLASEVQMYEGAQNRANAMELERMRRATADRPGETERIFNRFNELKAKDPAAAEQYLQSIERIKGLGRGVEEKAEFARLRQQATMLQNELKAAMETDPLGKSPRIADLRAKLDGIYKQLGGESAPAAGRTMTMADVQATAKASGKTVDEVKKAATAAGYTVQ